MLSLLWWLPLAVAAASAVPLWRAARRLEAEAAGLRTSAADLRRLQPLVAQVGAQLSGVTARAAPHGPETSTIWPPGRLEPQC
jgi:CubicO group peptidase (beta-lactamase class C family)